MVRTRLFLACVAPLLLGQQCIGPTTSDNEGAAPPSPPARVENPRVTLNTPQGTIVVELFAVQAPETTRIFLQNVRDKYFDDTIIHWAKADEGIRGGRYRADLTAKSVSTTIPNESGNQVPNRRRYLAMVDSSASGTTSAEFVIYTKDSKQYDYVAGDTPRTGRTVFGRVVDGMGVVDAIAALKTKTATAKNGDSLPNMPTETVTVTATQTTGENPPPSQAPSIACPPDVEAAKTGDRTPVPFGQATATDAEGNTLTVTNDAPPDGFLVGPTTVTWRATDSAGRTATCTQTVTVRGPASVRVQTSLGAFVIELYPYDAPKTVDNFLRYVRDGFYNGLIFHRVVKGFVIQTGAYRPDGSNPPTRGPIPNEFKQSNVRGTVAMAKVEDDPDSATSQWFVNLVDNSDNLDHQNGGFTVFGHVVEGMETVVDRIAKVPVDSDDKPFEDVVIESIEVIGDTPEPPVITTASGLKYQDLVVGTGEMPRDETAIVMVNYTGTLEDGTQFDKSDGAVFELTDVIPGFREGILSMRVGGKRRLIIPPELGYGTRGSPPKIPPNATLIFVVDLVEIKG